MNRAFLITGTLLVLAVLNLNRSQSSPEVAAPPIAVAQPRAIDAALPETAAPKTAVHKPPAPQPSAPQRRVQDTSVPDDRPIPKTNKPGEKSLFSRTIGEHFQSHPSTESRIVRLRQLAERRASGASGRTTMGERKSDDWIDVLVDVKNRSTHVATKVLAEIAGPLTLEEEWSAGQDIHDQLMGELKVDVQASDELLPLLGKLQDLLVRTKHQPYTLTVIEDEKVNAFSHLGGHLYVCRGLLELLHEENELLFVIGHEIGHIELGHCVLAATGGLHAERTLGELAVPPARMLQRLLALSYSEHDEFDADAWSYKAMRRLGKSDRDATDFFHALLAHEHQKQS